MALRVKKTTRYAERDWHSRSRFTSEIAKLNPDDLVYLDESGIDHSLHRLYARSPRKSRIYGDVSGKRVARTTLIAGYVRGGFIAPFRFKGYTDTSVFNQWVERCLIPDLRPGQTIILDNASFHKSKRTRELIEGAGCHILFQPPYSPDLNRIEPMWANIKQRLRSYFDETKTFYENLDFHFKDMCKC